MNKSLAFILIFISFFFLANGKPVKYTSKYDNIDIDQVLRNDRLLNNYVKCLLDKGPCTPQGAELKRNLGEALKTGCSKCTEIQKIKSQRALNYIRTNKREIWKELEAKYDPERIRTRSGQVKNIKKETGKPVFDNWKTNGTGFTVRNYTPRNYVNEFK